MDADICVIYASENKEIARKLVSLLRLKWNVWWDDDITQGAWRSAVKSQITISAAVVPIFSHIIEDKHIFIDEISFALEHKKLIFPFMVEQCEIPLGFGPLNYTKAFNWNGGSDEEGYQQLEKKISSELTKKKREKQLILTRKKMDIPNFVFSLSSYDTQVQPYDGVELFKFLKPTACLLSAYDVYKKKDDAVFLNNIKDLNKSNSILFLDSGNYESYRKCDLYTDGNLEGWEVGKFREIAGIVSPDICFSFDKPNPIGSIDVIVKNTINSYYEDEKNIQNRTFPIIPILHLPYNLGNSEINQNISDIAVKVAKEIDPVMIAIPERELGYGIKERFICVRDIRRALNELGKYYPLHLLGTGNPISMQIFATAGADSFDGLEWCRTVADYDKGFLFHFSQFHFFEKSCKSRIQSPASRAIIDNEESPYVLKVASYNFDYFCDSAKTMKKMIMAGQAEYLLRNIVPNNMGTELFEELING